jgi:phenylpropionate dioxygenase-like ring-hydroxylating dioxygenase large terminal subunit
MEALLDDRGVAARVLAHIAAGTTDEGGEVWREPVANYRSPERLAAEIERVLRRTPTPFCPSAALAERGSFVAREAAGRPIVVVRGTDGVVRGFANVCRHRGMQIANGTGCTRAFACRYHGWTYGLDGRLLHVPHEQGFPGLDRSRHGLAAVNTEERSGLVWVTQEPGVAHGGLDELPALVASDQRVFAAREFVLPANWKIFLEGFLEGYHIRPTHPDTFYPFGFDNLNVVERFGRNSRVTFPFQRIRKLAEVPPEERQIEGAVTYVTHLFPNAVLVLLSHHTVFIVLEPVSVGETRVFSWSMTNRPLEGEGAAAAERDSAFVNQTGGAEDAAVVCAIQRGLASDANDAFLFGRFEDALVHFHRNLDAALAATSS